MRVSAKVAQLLSRSAPSAELQYRQHIGYTSEPLHGGSEPAFHLHGLVCYQRPVMSLGEKHCVHVGSLSTGRYFPARSAERLYDDRPFGSQDVTDTILCVWVRHFLRMLTILLEHAAQAPAFDRLLDVR